MTIAPGCATAQRLRWRPRSDERRWTPRLTPAQPGGGGAARQPQPAPRWAPTAATSSPPPTSTGWPPGRCASTGTTPDRCRACRPATTCCSAPSTSCGGRGARSRCGRTAITHHLRRAGVTTMLVSDHPHLFETGGENYHTDFTAWDYVRGHEGDPWRTRPDPAGPAPPPCQPSPRRSTAYDDVPHLVPGGGRLPRPQDHGRGGGVARRRRRGPRPVPAGRGRVRPARALRHPRAVGLAVRPRLGGAPPDLAALRRRRAWRRACSPSAQAPGPAGQLRRQALDDRPLPRPGARRDGPAGPVGRHRRHPLHRPRPLPGREGRAGANRACRSTSR